MEIVCCALAFVGGILIVVICKVIYGWCERREW